MPPLAAKAPVGRRPRGLRLANVTDATYIVCSQSISVCLPLQTAPSAELRQHLENIMRTRTCLLLGALAATGCAHAPPPATVSSSESNTVAARPPPAPVNMAPSPAASDPDLDTLLHGQTLHFAFDEARLTSESEQRLQHIGEVMRSHPELKLSVAGNCDELGTEEYNLELGQKRAAAAQAYLARFGVDASRVTTVSYGKEHPVNAGHDEQARSANRRDDLQLQHM